MAGLSRTDSARLRKKAKYSSRVASPTEAKVTPHNTESLAQELRVHQIELELQCQQLQRAQREAEESRDRYRELYESIPIGYVTIDSEGRIYDLNPVGASILGVADNRRRLSNLSFLLSEGDGDALKIFCRKVLAEHEPGFCELNMKRMDGSPFMAALQAAPVQAGEGKGQRLRIAFKDVSDRKKVEEELQQQRVELEANRIELQDLMGKLFTAQEEERRRIACDLHDDHCQRLTALILEASSLSNQL